MFGARAYIRFTPAYSEYLYNILFYENPTRASAEYISLLKN